MRSLNYKIKALESSFLEDGAKWRIILQYKKALDEKISKDPVRILKKRLTISMIGKGITIKDIRANHSINPYPIGRSSLELVLAGTKISSKLTNKLNEYLCKT